MPKALKRIQKDSGDCIEPCVIKLVGQRNEVVLDLQVGVSKKILFVGLSNGYIYSTLSRSQRQAVLNLRRYFREQYNILDGNIDVMLVFDRFWSPVQCSTDI